jgi:hypothetical protein
MTGPVMFLSNSLLLIVQAATLMAQSQFCIRCKEAVDMAEGEAPRIFTSLYTTIAGIDHCFVTWARS